MIDWEAFLRSEGIHHVAEGKNVKSGELNIRCPFCGDDPSEHMGINLKSGFWACWRNFKHSGKRPARLIAAVKGIDFSEAVRVEGKYSSADTVRVGRSMKEIRDKVAAIGKSAHIEEVKADLKEWDSFKPIRYKRSGKRFYRYLRQRGFHNILDFIDRYQLRYSMSDLWFMRLIIPFFQDGKLVGWTGRSLLADEELRYRTAPKGPFSKQMLFNSDEAKKGGKVLIVVEGPFDCLKLAYYACKGVKVVATLGTSVTDWQVGIIVNLSRKYHKVVLMFDKEATRAQETLRTRLAVIGSHKLISYKGLTASDPGKLDRTAVRELTRSFLR